MAAPITFRNVPGAAAPDFGSSLEAMQRATQGPNVLDRFGDIAQGFVDNKQKQDTDAFVAKLNSFRDVDLGDGQGIVTADMQRQQFLEEQTKQKSFIDVGKATQAVSANRAQDFLKNAEGRAQTGEVRDQAKHEDDLLNSADIRGTREITDSILEVDKQIKEQSVKSGEIDLKSEELDLASQQRIETAAALKAKRFESNILMQSTPVFGQHDFAVINPRLSADPAGASPTDYLNADAVMLKELQEQFPGQTYEQYQTKIDSSYAANGLDIPRNAVFAQAKRTPAGKLQFNELQASAKRNFNFDKRQNDAVEKISKLEGPALRKEFVDYDADYRARLDRTPEQQAKHTQLENAAINSWEQDITGLKINGEDFTKLSSTQMTSGKIKAFERKMAKIIRKNENFPGAGEALVTKLTQRAVDLVGDGTFSTNLTEARNDIITQRNIAQATADAKKDITLAPIKAKALAIQNFQAEVAKINQEGVNIPTLSKSIFDNLVTNNAGESNVKVTFDDVNEGVNRVFKALTDLSPTLPPGEIQTIVRKFFNAKGAAASNAFWVISGGELSIRTGKNSKQEIENMTPEEIRDALISFVAKDQGKVVTPTSLTNKLKELTAKIIKAKTRNTVSSIIPGRKPDFDKVDALEKQREALQKQLDDIRKQNNQ